MTDPFRLKPLQDIAHLKNDEAARKLGALNTQQQSAEEKLAALQQFRRDYQQQYQAAVRQGMSAADMHNFQAFMQRLDQAILQQQQAIEQARMNVRQGQRDLLDSTRKMKSFDTLAQRHADHERVQQGRAEQRQQDEQSGRFAALNADKQRDKPSE